MEVGTTHLEGDSTLLLDETPMRVSEIHQGSSMLNGQCAAQYAFLLGQ